MIEVTVEIDPPFTTSSLVEPMKTVRDDLSAWCRENCEGEFEISVAQVGPFVRTSASHLTAYLAAAAWVAQTQAVNGWSKLPSLPSPNLGPTGPTGATGPVGPPGPWGTPAVVIEARARFEEPTDAVLFKMRWHS